MIALQTAILAGLLWMLWIAARVPALRAMRGAVLTYLGLQLEADSLDLYRIFGYSVYGVLNGLVRDGWIERVEGVALERRGGRPQIWYRWLNKAQREQRAEADVVPRWRS